MMKRLKRFVGDKSNLFVVVCVSFASSKLPAAAALTTKHQARIEPNTQAIGRRRMRARRSARAHIHTQSAINAGWLCSGQLTAERQWDAAAAAACLFVCVLPTRSNQQLSATVASLLWLGSIWSHLIALEAPLAT